MAGVFAREVVKQRVGQLLQLRVLVHEEGQQAGGLVAVHAVIGRVARVSVQAAAGLHGVQIAFRVVAVARARAGFVHIIQALHHDADVVAPVKQKRLARLRASVLVVPGEKPVFVFHDGLRVSVRRVDGQSVDKRAGAQHGFPFSLV